MIVKVSHISIPGSLSPRYCKCMWMQDFMARNPPNISCLLWHLSCFLVMPGMELPTSTTMRWGNSKLDWQDEHPHPHPHTNLAKTRKKNAVDKIHTGTFDLTTSFIGAKSVGVAIGVWSPKMQYLFAAQAVLFHWQRHRNHHGSKARFRLKKSGSHPSHRPCWRFHPPDRGTGNVGPSLRFEPDQVGWTEFLLVKMGGDNLFLFYFFCCWKKTLKVRCCFFGGGSV